MERDMWKNRRKHAIAAMLGLLASYFLPALGYVPVETIIAMEAQTIAFMYSMMAIIGAYMGFATAHDKWQKGK